MDIEYYTMDELRLLGCPDQLLMQYITFPKETIDRWIAKSEAR